MATTSLLPRSVLAPPPGSRAPAGRLPILCVHGVGHAEADPQLRPAWSNAISGAISRWAPGIVPEIKFFEYDDLFAEAPLDPIRVAEAMAKLAVSGIIHGVGDFFGGMFGRQRAFGDIGDTLRWTAGMIVQWVENEGLRNRVRQRFLDTLRSVQPQVVLAHSLGSLISYETFARPANQSQLAKLWYVSFGSQIGNPFVRSSVALAGRINPLPARHWFHLFNPHDNVFTAKIRLHTTNFTQIDARFDDPGLLDHDAVRYLTHANTVGTVWRKILEIEPSPVRAFGRAGTAGKMQTAFKDIARRPDRRALLVGINEYPDPSNRLEGCVNDVFLMSSVLQECGFEAENIRVVLNERATAQGVRERLEWLLEGADNGQDRVFYYSGHGAQMPGYGAFEKVNQNDECLVTYDFDWTQEHAITDDQFYELYSQLPYQTRFLTIFDCCHSGGMTRDGSLRARGINPPDDIRHRLLRWDRVNEMWTQRDLPEMGRNLSAKEQKRFFGDKEKDTMARKKLGYASGLRVNMGSEFEEACKAQGHKGPFMPVIMKACQENEYAYEYRHGVISHGAFTYALAQIFRAKRKNLPTWKDLVSAVGKTLDELKYKQHPEIDGPSAILKTRIKWKPGR